MRDPATGVWKRPGLIVLTRAEPEEAVLWACKLATYATGNVGHQIRNGGYYQGGNCHDCSTAAGS